MLKLLERTHIRVESLAVLAGLIVIMAMFSPTTGSGVRVFLTASNFFNIILATATFGILAIGATFVISAAGIDLSLGSVLGLASVSGAALVVTLEWPWYFAIVGALAAGAAAGMDKIDPGLCGRIDKAHDGRGRRIARRAAAY